MFFLFVRYGNYSIFALSSVSPSLFYQANLPYKLREETFTSEILSYLNSSNVYGVTQSQTRLKRLSSSSSSTNIKTLNISDWNRISQVKTTMATEKSAFCLFLSKSDRQIASSSNFSFVISHVVVMISYWNHLGTYDGNLVCIYYLNIIFFSFLKLLCKYFLPLLCRLFISHYKKSPTSPIKPCNSAPKQVLHDLKSLFFLGSKLSNTYLVYPFEMPMVTWAPSLPNQTHYLLPGDMTLFYLVIVNIIKHHQEEKACSHPDFSLIHKTFFPSPACGTAAAAQ